MKLENLSTLFDELQKYFYVRAFFGSAFFVAREAS